MSITQAEYDHFHDRPDDRESETTELQKEFEEKFMYGFANWNRWEVELLNWIQQKIKEARIDENIKWRHEAEFNHPVTDEQFNNRIKELGKPK